MPTVLAVMNSVRLDTTTSIIININIIAGHPQLD